MLFNVSFSGVLSITPAADVSEYVASAVHFDGATSLSGSISIPDTPFCSFSAWVKVPTDIASNVFFTDATNYNLTIRTLWGSGSLWGMGWAAAEANSSNWVDAGPFQTGLSFDTWLWVCGMLDTNHPLGERRIGSLVNGTDVLVAGDQGSGEAFSMQFDGLTFGFPDSDDAPYYKGDASDVYIAPGQYIDFSDVAVQAKFRDPVTHKPVYLGANGELPTGTPPQVFFSGDSSSFATNRGLAGPFTLTGALTNANSSPSD